MSNEYPDHERLQDLEEEHYLLEDRIKSLAEQIAELEREHRDRIALLVEEKRSTKQRLILVDAEAARLRPAKQAS